MQVTFILSMIFAVVIALFAVANSEPVTINLILKSFQLSQAVVILVSAVVGAVIVFLLSLVSRAKSAVKAKNLNKELTLVKRQLETCQTELEKLKVPVSEEAVPVSAEETSTEETQ